ncbi:gluconokinase, GntK/IdnK-type [Agrococcus versicolor]|uniref:Gluconokinase n=1 Tax=Agrococcus versicolor TaxID=501482 RepID=A0ABP5MCG1_9MICO
MREVLVIAGVAGCGKSTVAAALARELGWALIEGDDHHDEASVARMRDGTGLTDVDRTPWLGRIATTIRGIDGSSVVACSALAHRHREVLRSSARNVSFVQLSLSTTEATRRLAARRGHFARSSLVASQFRDLEPLRPDESGVIVDATESIDTIVASVVADRIRRADRLAR